MTAGDDRISSTGKKRLRRGCLFFIVVFSIGFYAGLAATKRALTGPDWVRKVAGITLPPAGMPPAPPQQPGQITSNNNQPPQYNNSNPPAGNNNQNTQGPMQGAGDNAQPDNGGQANMNSGLNQAGAAGNPAPTHPSVPQTPPPGGWLVGDWEITDQLHPTGSQSSSVTSMYVFEDGGTGEFDTNGKKLYDIHWEDAGEYLLITFVTDTDGEQNLKVKMKYSINPDHSLLTMAPMGKKDPRGEMYSQGPGVYHRK